MELKEALSLVNELFTCGDADEFTITLKKCDDPKYINVKISVELLTELNLRPILDVLANHKELTYKLDECSTLEILNAIPIPQVPTA